MRHICPPVGLLLHIAQDHVLHRRRQPRDLPRDVGLPAAPGLAEVLQNSAGLVLLHALGHHVQDVVHDSSAQLQVEVAFNPLLGDGLCHTLRLPALELPSQQVPKPALQQGDDATQEEDPHAPHWSPEATAGPLTNRAGVEAVVDQVLQVLAHANLPHEAVLVAVHAGELAHMAECVLQTVRELEGIHVTQAELDVAVNHQLGQAQDLAAQVEGVSEAALLSLLGRQGFDWLQVEVVVKVEVVKILAVDEQVQHVVALAADLQASLHPVQLGCLEELGGPQAAEQVLLLQAFWRPLVELVQHVALQELLVAHSDLDGVASWAVLFKPGVDKRDIQGTAHKSRPRVEGPGRPQQADARACVVCVKRVVVQERPHFLRKRERILVLSVILQLFRLLGLTGVSLVEGDGVDKGIVVVRRQIWVFNLDVHHLGMMVLRQPDLPWPVVVQVRERHLVLSADGRPNDEFVDVIEFVPVFVTRIHVAEQWLELGATGDAHVEALGGDERFVLKQVEVVSVHEVAEELASQTVQG
mmetsp:Transcript_39887/g.113149  ORF Transcript_39887/g.113149 Transcript_39887/m.113149 type:complete len:527 (-) Transcript_39887:833-2413(-)